MFVPSLKYYASRVSDQITDEGAIIVILQVVAISANLLHQLAPLPLIVGDIFKTIFSDVITEVRHIQVPTLTITSSVGNVLKNMTVLDVATSVHTHKVQAAADIVNSATTRLVEFLSSKLEQGTEVYGTDFASAAKNWHADKSLRMSQAGWVGESGAPKSKVPIQNFHKSASAAMQEYLFDKKLGGDTTEHLKDGFRVLFAGFLEYKIAPEVMTEIQNESEALKHIPGVHHTLMAILRYNANMLVETVVPAAMDSARTWAISHVDLGDGTSIEMSIGSKCIGADLAASLEIESGGTEATTHTLAIVADPMQGQAYTQGKAGATTPDDQKQVPNLGAASAIWSESIVFKAEATTRESSSEIKPGGTVATAHTNPMFADPTQGQAYTQGKASESTPDDQNHDRDSLVSTDRNSWFAVVNRSRSAYNDASSMAVTEANCMCYLDDQEHERTGLADDHDPNADKEEGPFTRSWRRVLSAEPILPARW